MNGYNPLLLMIMLLTVFDVRLRSRNRLTISRLLPVPIVFRIILFHQLLEFDATMN